MIIEVYCACLKLAQTQYCDISWKAQAFKQAFGQQMIADIDLTYLVWYKATRELKVAFDILKIVLHVWNIVIYLD